MRLYDVKYAVMRAVHGCASLLAPNKTYPNLFHGLEELERAVIDQLSPGRYDAEEPIFLFATGWRTGSTLMQRILMTDPNLLMWGEPYGRMGILSRLGDMVASFDRSIAPNSVVLKERPGFLSDQWVANLYPRTSAILEALQSFVYDWLARPAKELGFDRWGMKEVRLGYSEAALLRLLFPKAKFVVITRNPYDAYRSAMQLGSLWERWPDRLVNNPYSYGATWNRLALSWKSRIPDFPVRLYRFEDLVGGMLDFHDLGVFCQLNLKPEVAVDKKVGAGCSTVTLSVMDKWLLNQSTGPARLWLSY